MRYEIDQYSRILRDARKRMGLSQRELAQRIGITQGHVSKIERGEVDMQLTTLLDSARALGLELMLLPRSDVRFAEALLKSSRTSESEGSDQWSQHMARKIRRVRERFVEGQIGEQEGRQVTQTLADLWAVVSLVPHDSRPEVEQLVDALSEKRLYPERVTRIVQSLRRIRADIVHREPAEVRPAYRLHEEE